MRSERSWWSRSLTFLAGLIFCAGAGAQDWDIRLKGGITDHETGKAIPFVTVSVVDILSIGVVMSSTGDVNGQYDRELYSGAIVQGGSYVVEFAAPGYASRQVVIDASAVVKDDLALAWRIHMDVPLVPVRQGEKPRTVGLLGTCRWHAGSRTLRWKESKAARSYPIERYMEPRLLVHTPLVDAAYAQDGMMMDGVVREHWSDQPLEGVSVRVTSHDGPIPMDTTYTTDVYGYYVLVVPEQGSYSISFSRPDLVGKRLLIHPNTIPAGAHEPGFRANVDIRLFPPLPAEDLSFLQEPIGILVYDAGQENMVWDMDYSGPLLQRLNTLLQRHAPSGPIEGR